MAGIKEDIKTLNFKSVYLLTGEEDYLKDIYKKMLVDKVLDSSFADFNYKEYISKKPDTDEVSDFVSSYPCMSEKKILYIKDSDLFKKSTDAEKKYWKSLFDDMPDFVIIIFNEKNIDKKSALYKKIASDYSFDEFNFQKLPDLVNWIGRHLAEYKKQMDPAVCQYLIDCCSPSMYILNNEIEKLASFVDGPKITQKDIDICCCKIPESRVFDMIDNALDGKTGEALQKYNELKMLKEEPVAINGAIFSKLNQILKIKKLSATMSAREIAFATNQKEFIVNLNMKKAKNISYENISKLVELCVQTDHKIKTGDSWAALDILVASIANI